MIRLGADHLPRLALEPTLRAHLLSGEMENLEWRAASGDFTYAIRENRETSEPEAVRYRRVLPAVR